MAFEPITRSTISSQIRDQILALITEGELEPGARLSSERALTEQFGVARTSVREAMQGLVSMGVVERRGNRVFVVEHLPEIVLEEDDGRKQQVRLLFETRGALEPTIFELAATRSSAEQRERIMALAADFDPDLDLEAFRKLDRQFHTTVASACGNPFLIELYGKVLDRLFRSEDFHSLLFQPQNAEQVGRIIEKSAAHHVAIAAAIGSGDVAATREAALEHLGEVEARMISELI